MENKKIDKGNAFDFGRTSKDYGKYRDIYPRSMYEKLMMFGIGNESQIILDLGSGTGVLPRNMYYTKAKFYAMDISKQQIEEGKKIAIQEKCNGIEFRVGSAEQTGFEDDMFDAVTAVQCFQYFEEEKATKEISRILKEGGRFCKIFMDWLPYEDVIVKEMEELVLAYNPSWSGCKFKEFRYTYPKWVANRFEIETIHSYKEYLPFEKDAWQGRIRTCRGIGASLSSEKIEEFDNAYKEILKKYPGDILNIKHQIHIEIYRNKRNRTI